MKTNFFKNIVCGSLLMVLASGCGAEKDKKSAPAAPTTDNGATAALSTMVGATDTTQAQGQAALTNFATWYNSTVEANIPAELGPRYVTRYTYFYNTSNGCSNKPVSILGFSLGSINLCFNSSSQVRQPVKSEIIVNITSSGSKASVPKIGTFNFQTYQTQYGAIYNVTQNGNMFIFTIKKSNGTLDTVVFDKGLNSALNPVYISDNANGKEDRLFSY